MQFEVKICMHVQCIQYMTYFSHVGKTEMLSSLQVVCPVDMPFSAH